MADSESLKNPIRSKCPFYGFALFNNLMTDSRGNQCPLLDGYAPCQRAEEPNWNSCELNVGVAQKGLAILLENGRIFPEEFKPKNSDSWQGISFKDWYSHIMDGKEIPGYAS